MRHETCSAGHASNTHCTFTQDCNPYNYHSHDTASPSISPVAMARAPKSEQAPMGRCTPEKYDPVAAVALSFSNLPLRIPSNRTQLTNSHQCMTNTYITHVCACTHQYTLFVPAQITSTSPSWSMSLKWKAYTLVAWLELLHVPAIRTADGAPSAAH